MVAVHPARRTADHATPSTPHCERHPPPTLPSANPIAAATQAIRQIRPPPTLAQSPLPTSSYAGRPAKAEKSEPPSFHYKKVSHLVFATKIHWDALPQISGVFWIWICIQIDVLNLNLHSNLELTYYIFLGIGVRQMTSPQVSELCSKKELPVIFLSLPAREQATIHILLP
jgi:hypothetical protein